MREEENLLWKLDELNEGKTREDFVKLLNF